MLGVGDDIARRGRVAAARDGVEIGDRDRGVVEDRNLEARRNRVAVDVGDADHDRLRRRIADHIVGQRKGIFDRVRIDRDDIEGAGGELDRLPLLGHRDAVDRDGARSVDRAELDRAEGEIGIVAGARARGLAVALGKPGFVDDAALAARDGNGQRRRAVGDTDRQRRGRRVAVAVGQAIGEDVGHAARRPRAANIDIAAVGADEQAAILPLDRRPGRQKGGRRLLADSGDERPVGAERIGPRRAAGRARAGDHIARHRAAAARLAIVDVGARDRGIVGDRQGQRRGADIAVAVGDRHRHDILRIGRGGVVDQYIAVADGVGRDAGDRDQAHRRGDRLADRRDHGAVDRNDSGLVERGDQDRAGDGFLPRRLVRSRRLVAARTERGFRNRRGGGGDARRLVGGADDDFGFVVDLVGNDFARRAVGQPEIGRRQQVAEREGIADAARRFGKIAPRTLNRPGGGFGPLLGDQRGDGRGRDGDRPDPDQRNVERAVDDDENLSVGQRDDQVVARQPDRVEPGSGRKLNDIAGRNDAGRTGRNGRRNDLCRASLLGGSLNGLQFHRLMAPLHLTPRQSLTLRPVRRSRATKGGRHRRSRRMAPKSAIFAIVIVLGSLWRPMPVPCH